jgi:hypothetical protein
VHLLVSALVRKRLDLAVRLLVGDAEHPKI